MRTARPLPYVHANAASYTPAAVAGGDSSARTGETHPRHGGPEALEQRADTVLRDRLARAVHEALVSPLRRALQARLDDLRVQDPRTGVSLSGAGTTRRRSKRTSGGIASVHMATPAEPPAIMTALSDSAAGSCPAGVSAFLTIS